MSNMAGLETGWDEHFAYSMSRDDRSRASRLSSRNGRTSPTNSAHGNLLRHSILKLSDDKKAKKVRFYRNGDRFFKGMVYAVSPERFRTFESLLANLTDSPLGDKAVLPHGVRHVFSVDGSKKVTKLEELKEGESYVCASTDVFRRAEYDNTLTPAWNSTTGRKAKSRETLSGSQESQGLLFTSRDPNIDEHRDFIRPKLVTIIRNGSKPRKAVRVLLNRKTAHSFDQVLTDITEAIKLDTGAVKRIFTVDGRPVQSLADFFQDETIFVAYGPERYYDDDFDLDENEVKYVAPYRAREPGERVTLRSSKSSRRSASSKNLTEDIGYCSPRSSPKTPKKLRAVSAPKYRTFNGPDGDEFETGPPTLAQTYEIGRKIGEGNFSIVKECIHKRTKKRYALKIIEKEKCRGKEQMIQNEVAILKRVKHPNIVELVEDFHSHTELFLVMELVKGGDLFDAISMATKYTEKDACAMMFNLASALEYLHSNDIVHRDLKPENLLVCDHGDGTKSLKLGDFGLATSCNDPLFVVCGTPTYVAPEILKETGYGREIDVWAAGVIMYILLCGFPPFASAKNDQEELFDAIIEKEVDFPANYWDGVSKDAKDLIKGMLRKNPDERLTARQVTEHDWVTSEKASERDIHDSIATEIKSHFKRKPKPSMSSAGIRLVATTALDKQSRFFEGRKQAKLSLPAKKADVSNGQQEEVF
ncbi:DCLK1-like protein [Mya arenaria]|uniref:non-specific serine/threonine protein kinase n=2 Tax=Mya arenaria TaxID=6604 RepID=A0ABY7DS19_MYAAR|nr:serine/threonine-protein kinase DCLK1-like isoform X2 [Mya arenaria]XP_052792761.1 serine/threonine-protein kinase DCLK1-like isoform X2 [Mya arenaria]XP_052792762.1 serine/threonine-protein kinase DCLK1-like isoform X2 [Mya arenaria]WAQ99903.1 DCLK1-like protein [Mya arenaria]